MVVNSFLFLSKHAFCFLYLAFKRDAKYSNDCLSVRLFSRKTHQPHGRTSPKFLCVQPMAVARSSVGVAICYVLPV